MPDEYRGLKPEGPIYERRKFVRIGGKFVVSYSDISTTHPKTDISQTKDISLGGLLLTTDRKFETGSILRLKIRIPENPDYLNVKVRVVGSKERVKNLLYETRVKFIGISDEDRDAINKVVEYNFRKKQQP